VAWGYNNYGQINTPANLRGVVQVAGGRNHSLVVGANLPPFVLSTQVSGYPNHDSVISLPGFDANGDALLFDVSIPTRGVLYQYQSGIRGPQIVSSDSPIIDPLGRVIFAPVTDGLGSPHAVFSFSANDGESTSNPGSVSINIILPPAPRINPTNSIQRTNGSFELNFTGHSNATYSVYASTNLLDWEKLGFAAPLSPGLFNFMDPAATNRSHRFYRPGAP